MWLALKLALTRLFMPKTYVVRAIVRGTSGLELSKDDKRLLPIVDGMYGVVEVRGNALPEFKYRVFDERLMEFVQMTAYVALPSKIEFYGSTEDLGEINIEDAYKRPFLNLARHLARYFPLLPEKKEPPRVLA